MNLIEILLLITLCWCSLLWLYIKYKTRNLPSFEQALSIYAESAENLSLILKEQSEHVNKMIKDLERERDKLLEDYDEPD